MSNEKKPTRTAIEKLVEVVAQVRAGKTVSLESLYVAEIVRECRAEIINEMQAGANDEPPNDAEIQERIRQRFFKILRPAQTGELTVEASLRRQAELWALAFAMRAADLPKEKSEWLAFVEQLTHRQGTHMPDWSAFYAERAELDRRISDRGDG